MHLSWNNWYNWYSHIKRKIKTDKEKWIQFKWIKTLTPLLIIGTKIKQQLENQNKTIIIPEFKNENNIIEYNWRNVFLEAKYKE